MASVTSMRKRKKQADALGLSERELQMAELLEEVLDHMRWMQILGYTNQYILERKLKVDRDERDKILEAATRAVERDGKLSEWQERLARIKGEAVHIKREINRSKRQMARARRAGAPQRQGEADGS